MNEQEANVRIVRYVMAAVVLVVAAVVGGGILGSKLGACDGCSPSGMAACAQGCGTNHMVKYDATNRICLCATPASSASQPERNSP